MNSIRVNLRERVLDNFVDYALRPALDISGAMIAKPYEELNYLNGTAQPLSQKVPTIAKVVGVTAIAIPIGLVTLLGGSAIGAVATGCEYAKSRK